MVKGLHHVTKNHVTRVSRLLGAMPQYLRKMRLIYSFHLRTLQAITFGRPSPRIKTASGKNIARFRTLCTSGGNSVLVIFRLRKTYISMENSRLWCYDTLPNHFLVIKTSKAYKIFLQDTVKVAVSVPVFTNNIPVLLEMQQFGTGTQTSQPRNLATCQKTLTDVITSPIHVIA